MSPERLRPLASSASASAAAPAKESKDESGCHTDVVKPAEGKAWLENWLEGEEDVYDLPCTD